MTRQTCQTSSTPSNTDKTEEEHAATALLLGMEHVAGSMMIGGHFYTAYRKRVGNGRYAGCALFTYYFADTLKPISGMIELSQLDQPLKRKDTAK